MVMRTSRDQSDGQGLMSDDSVNLVFPPGPTTAEVTCAGVVNRRPPEAKQVLNTPHLKKLQVV